ncbi:MAG: class I SAM-dependent methyltransferase [Pseudomonadales bacterium]
MATSKEHYEKLLAPVYSWMLGGFEASIQRNSRLFDRYQLAPQGSGHAVDLGAGCGFQSIPLLMRGYTVTAIDLNEFLLNQLREHVPATAALATFTGDMLRFRDHVCDGAELVA